MKKSEANQRTLFQSWGGRNNNKPSTSHFNNASSYSTPAPGIDPTALIEIDDEDDDGLLAAALAMDSIADNTSSNHTVTNNALQTSHSTSQPVEKEILPGFDMESGNIWIYPTNYPVRNYQYDIVEKAMYQNTMVTLPTGLGKTFIAAVMMYNYYRWYPQGKVVFMAPTKPLVAQQIEACYKIMGIPQDVTAQMTGNMAPSKREALWKSRRVFFLTPQVVQNDLSRGSCVADDIVLVVIDEAHKALGNHAYCQVVREIAGYTTNFRVLALSATPGDDIKAVQQVLTNLLISHVELRSEDSPDIQPYTHARTVDKIVVPLGDHIVKIKTQFLKVLEGIVGRLFCNRAIWQKDPLRVSKFMLLSSREQFRKGTADNLSRAQVGSIEGDFAMGISLYHAYELLHQHGILSFYNFIKAIMDGSKGMSRAKTEMTKHQDFMEIMQDLSESIETPPDEAADSGLLFSQFNSPRRRKSMQLLKASDPRFKSHPKLLKLEEIVVEHFEKFAKAESGSVGGADGGNKSCSNTRVMIFSQYRDSVNEITTILCRHKPLVRVMSFIGQASTGKSSRGLSQKEQLEVVHRFRTGGYNTLVSTCVGEEGLDIGDVDLIVCFDAHASPIRLVQRMGRTGRKRDGRIVVLVTEGKEEQVYKRSLYNKKSIHKAIVKGTKSFELYEENPRMIPKHLTPTVLKMPMTVGEYVAGNKRKRKSDANESNGKIKDFLSHSAKPSSTTTVPTDRSGGLLTYDELVYWQENFKLPQCEAGTTPKPAVRRRSTSESPASSRRRSRDPVRPAVQPLSLTEWMAWQSAPSPVHHVTHSRRTEHLIEILEFVELHGSDVTDENYSYDMEMSAFLDTDDISVGDETRSTTSNGNDNDDEHITKKGKKQNKKSRMTSDPSAIEIIDDDEIREAKSNNNAKDGNNAISKKKKKRSSREKTISPKERKTKWKEYLNAFEKDEDFDDCSLKQDISTVTKCTTVASESVSAYDSTAKAANSFQVSEQFTLDDEIFIENDRNDSWTDQKQNQAELNHQIGAPMCHEDNDAVETGMESLSQLLPSSTPRSDHPTNARLHTWQYEVNDVPTPPSLDLLDFSLSPQKSVDVEVKRKDFSLQRRAVKRNFLSAFEDDLRTIDTAKNQIVNQSEDAGQDKPCLDTVEQDNLRDKEADGIDFHPGDRGTCLDADEQAKLRDQEENGIDLQPGSGSTCLDTVEQANRRCKGEDRLDYQLGSHSTCLDAVEQANRRDQEEEGIDLQSGGGSTWQDAVDHNNLLDQVEIVTDYESENGSTCFGAGIVANASHYGCDDDIEIEFGDDSILGNAFSADFGNEDQVQKNDVVKEHCEVQSGKEDMSNGQSVGCIPSKQDKRLTSKSNSAQCRNIHSDNGRELRNIVSKPCGREQADAVAFKKPEPLAVESNIGRSINKLSLFKRTPKDNELSNDKNNSFGNEATVVESRPPDQEMRSVAEKRSRRDTGSATLTSDNMFNRPQQQSRESKLQAASRGRHPPDQEVCSVAEKRSRDTGSASLTTLSKRPRQQCQESKLQVASHGRRASSLTRNTNKDLLELFDNETRVGSSKPESERRLSSSQGQYDKPRANSNVDSPEKESNRIRHSTEVGEMMNGKSRKLDLKSKTSMRTKRDQTSNVMEELELGQDMCNLNRTNEIIPPIHCNEESIQLGGERRTAVNVETVDTKDHLPCDEEEDSPVTKTRRKTKPKVLDSPALSQGCTDSPVARRRSKARTTSTGCVVAIAESDEDRDDDEEEEEEDEHEEEEDEHEEEEEVEVIKPVGRASIYRRQALFSPLSQQTKKPDARGVGGRERQEDCGSEDEFEFGNAKGISRSVHKRDDDTPIKFISSKTKMRSLSRGNANHRKNQQRYSKNNFIEDEAELSGSEIDEYSSGDDHDHEENSELDSFIDDATQATQQATQVQDMHAIYRQSLFSPVGKLLNFKTPTFNRQRNRYKMKYNVGRKRSDSASEAEETNEHESDLENELSGSESDEEHLSNNENEESPVQPRYKRVKRKRILDDSIEDVSPKVSKQCMSPAYRTSSLTLHTRNSLQKPLETLMVNTAEVRTANRNTSISLHPQPNSQKPLGGKVENTADVWTAIRNTSITSHPNRNSQKPLENLLSNTAEVRNGMKSSTHMNTHNTSTKRCWTFKPKTMNSIDARQNAATCAASRGATVNVFDTKKQESCKFTGRSEVHGKVTRDIGSKSSRTQRGDVEQMEMQEIADAMAETDDTIAMDMDDIPTFSLAFDDFDLSSVDHTEPLAGTAAPSGEHRLDKPSLMSKTFKLPGHAKQSQSLTEPVKAATPSVSSVGETKRGKSSFSTKTFKPPDLAEPGKATLSVSSVGETKLGKSSFSSKTFKSSGIGNSSGKVTDTVNFTQIRPHASGSVTRETTTQRMRHNKAAEPAGSSQHLNTGVSSGTLTSAKTAYSIAVNSTQGSVVRDSKAQRMQGQKMSEEQTPSPHLSASVPAKTANATVANCTRARADATVTSQSGLASNHVTITTSPSGLTPSQRNKDKLVILVDSKEISNSQVVSLLRRKHQMRADVCQLTNCHYIVSSRMAVERMRTSALANGANSTKLVARMRMLCSLYERPCLIIEKDRVKPGEQERNYTRSNAYHSTLSCISLTHIKVLFSSSQEETAHLLSELAIVEAKKKAAITAPLTMNKEVDQVFRFLLSIPLVNYVTALSWCCKFRTIRDVINSSPSDFQRITGHLSRGRAEDIHAYLRHPFNPDMLGKLI